MVNSILEEGPIPFSFREGNVVSFLKKGKNSDDPNSYRPITLLNSDYKLVTKLLVNHFNGIASHLIHSDKWFHCGEAASNEYTFFSWSPRLFWDPEDSSISFFFLDAEKAFDLVIWESLFFILSKFGIPSKITELIEKLYMKAEANIIINILPRYAK